MATELDALQFNFTANTSGANQSIEKLISKLGSLREAIGLVNSESFVANAENMVESMNAIKTVADQTNSENLKNIASGIRTLASATKNLTNGATIREFFGNLEQGIAALNGNTMDFGNINSLLTNVAKLGGGNVVKAGESLGKIAEGIKQFQGVTLPSLEGIDQFVTSLRSLGSKTIVQASNSIGNLASGLKQFQGLNVNVKGLSELAQSLSVFGRKTAQTAITSIPQLATAFRNLIVTLSTAPKISRNVIDLANALAQFLANANRVGNSARSASKGMLLLGNTAKRTQKKVFSLASAIGKIYATYFLLFRAFGAIRKSIDISSDLKEVQNVVDSTFGTMADKVEDFAKTSITSFGLSELSAKKYASRFQAMGTAMGITASSIDKAQKQLNAINPELAARGYNDLANSMADVSLNITKLTADIASFYNVSQEDVAKDLESIFTGSTRPLRTYGLDITNATLQTWALNNGLDVNVKKMSQQEKTLLRYQYVLANTSAAQGDFAKTSITWANQIRILGQNFERLGQVIGTGFIAWLRPAVVTINKYMDSIIYAVQRVVNALGQIFGWQMIVDTSGGVVEDVEGIADAYDDATDSAKKFKQQLLGIDELNNLTTKDNGSGSSDAGGVGFGGTNIIKPGGIDFVPFESDIKNLYDLGKRFSDALKRLLPDSWDEIYEKARNFGRGLADFLNGLIQPETFAKLGKTIAGTIMTVTSSITSFAEDADWEKWGVSIGESITSFFDELDGGKLANAQNKIADGIWTAIKNAVKNIEWGDVFQDMIDWLSNIKLSTIALWIGAITIKNVGGWILGGGALKSLGLALSKGISGLNLGGALKSLGGAKGLFTTSLKTIFGAGTATEIGLTIGTALVSGIAAAISGFGLGTKLGKLLMGKKAPKMTGFEIAQELWNGIKNGDIWIAFGQMFSDLFNAINENVIQPVAGYFSDLWEGIKLVWGLAATWFNDNVIKPIVDFFRPAVTNIIAFFEGCWIIIQAIWKVASTWFNNTVIKPLGEFFAWLWDGISGAAKWAWDGIVAVWEIVSEWFNKWVIQPVSDAFGKAWSDISQFFKDAYDFAVELWVGLSGWFDKWVIQPISSVFEWLWDGIKIGFKGVGNFIVGLFEGVINGMIDAVNWFIKGFSNIVEWAGDIIGKDWRGMTLISHVELPRFEAGGFPDQGSLFVAGETYGQTEWLGNVNGRTGVVSGNEITGIADAIYQTSAEEMELLRQQNNYLVGILNKEFGISTNQIGKAAREYAQDYSIRNHGRQAYQF